MTTYSHSRLSAFEDCRLKYKFAYIDHIKREGDSIEAFMGSRFHEVMERVYLKVSKHPLTQSKLCIRIVCI
jgi:putative RecB family exonuclease